MTIKQLIRLIFLIAATTSVFAQGATDDNHSKPPVEVLIKTDFGDFRAELYPDKAPATVANFLRYVRSYYYDGLVFHRVVRNFVIQTGGYTFDLSEKNPSGDTIVNESDNGLKNRRGTLAMARHADPDSARAQFFVNLNDNSNLDPAADKPGYTVFGQVVEGMGVVDRIGNTQVRRTAKFQHLPDEPIRILSIREIPKQ